MSFQLSPVHPAMQKERQKNRFFACREKSDPFIFWIRLHVSFLSGRTQRLKK